MLLSSEKENSKSQSQSYGNEGLIKMKSHFEQTLKDIRSKEIENLKLKLKSEYEEKFQQAKEEYKDKVAKHKKEI